MHHAFNKIFAGYDWQKLVKTNTLHWQNIGSRYNALVKIGRSSVEINM